MKLDGKERYILVLALLSDIHGNIHALDACLQWIQKEEIDGIV